MKTLILALLLVVGLGPAPIESGGASAPARVVVFFWHDSPNDIEALEGLRRGFEVCGLEIRREIHANQDESLARRELAAVAKSGVDVVVAFGTRSTQIAADVLEETPIVFSAVTNPVLSEICPSWAGSGRNLAGNSNWLDRRRMLDVFRQGVPNMRRIGILRSPDNAVSRAELEEARKALRADDELEIVDYQVADPSLEKLDAVLDRALAEVDAIWLPIDYELYQTEPLERIVERSRAAKKPLLSSAARAAGAGALLTLTVDYRLLGMKAAALVRRVVAGEEPGTMPIGRLRSTHLHVDLRAARAIGLELPIDLLLGAHRIEGAGGDR